MFTPPSKTVLPAHAKLLPGVCCSGYPFSGQKRLRCIPCTPLGPFPYSSNEDYNIGQEGHRKPIWYDMTKAKSYYFLFVCSCCANSRLRHAATDSHDSMIADVRYIYLVNIHIAKNTVHTHADISHISHHTPYIHSKIVSLPVRSKAPEG